ncbi:MAG: hypothetical protein KAS36_17175 [Anaerolineales bacterium]|nr:hypothetical protein [Anaerolineales bacterium]
MKRLIIALAFLLSAGLAFAGGGFDQQEQRSVPQQVEKKDNGWSVGDYIAASGVVVTAVGIAGGLYLNSRRKKKE